MPVKSKIGKATLLKNAVQLICSFLFIHIYYILLCDSNYSSHQNYRGQWGMRMNIYNPSTGRLREEDNSEFEANLGLRIAWTREILSQKTKTNQPNQSSGQSLEEDDKINK